MNGGADSGSRGTHSATSLHASLGHGAQLGRPQGAPAAAIDQVSVAGGEGSAPEPHVGIRNRVQDRGRGPDITIAVLTEHQPGTEWSQQCASDQPPTCLDSRNEHRMLRWRLSGPSGGLQRRH
ncbi:hypothetical protein GGTG_09964 [Gaeumannomyces tritici R3-111a-1]|uniref:Uncharacterized protein n=1 Tax=Gaeumannomyces tritici (strain R3-111a-1) TaxID=644352 RepID=J3P8X9_GAET3|nr:hypothetical protein GGTG_09964 [Gaeumannomyces tritici R3-111a-1]EJT73114.1 hypothetical protein GGTG_09964 [Gaeumannomyces tritici R3-111a-1]